MIHIVRKTTDPVSAPTVIGQHWINETSGVEWFSIGTATLADWIPRVASSFDHGLLTGLSDDDHPQYHNDTRGDIRYYTKSQSDINYEPKNSNIQAHIIDTGNPHGVTKAQVGLSNVVNLNTSTSANITDSTNKRFVTDANLVVINNTSGVNTGDQNLSGYELLSNKATNLTLPDNIKYPTTLAVSNELATKQPLSSKLTALAAHIATGLIVQTATDVFEGREILGGTGISITNGNGILGNPTISSTITQYTNEMAQDAVGNILTNSSNINFTYNDGSNTITAEVTNASITNAKLNTVPTQTFKGRTTAGLGAPEDLTIAQAKTLLDLAGSNTGDQDLSGLVPYSGATANLNLGTFTMVDAADVDSILPNGRLLLTDVAGISIAWNARQLIDNSGNVVFDYGTGRLSDTFGNQAIQLDNRALVDVSIGVSLDWGNRYARNSTADITINWEARELYESNSGFPTINWELHHLIDISYDSGEPVASWSGGFKVYNNTVGLVADFDIGAFYSQSSGALVLDTSGRYLYDDYNVISVDWNFHTLSTINSTTLHWEQCYLNDVDGFLSLQWTTRTLETDFSGTSLDWQNRTLNGPSGVSVLYWATSNRVGILTSSPGATLDVVGTVKLGSGGTVFQKILSATASLNFPSIAALSVQVLTITVTGATVGASVTLGPPSGLEAGLIFAGFVSAANTVSIRLFNTTAIAVDPANATWRATVINF